MRTPEDVATEKHFTPPTLTKQLYDCLWRPYKSCSPDPQSIVDLKGEIITSLKTVIKEWLRTVGLPQQMSEEATRQLLITLVDEP